MIESKANYMYSENMKAEAIACFRRHVCSKSSEIGTLDKEYAYKIDQFDEIKFEETKHLQNQSVHFNIDSHYSIESIDSLSLDLIKDF